MDSSDRLNLNTRNKSIMLIGKYTDEVGPQLYSSLCNNTSRGLVLTQYHDTSMYPVADVFIHHVKNQQCDIALQNIISRQTIMLEQGTHDPSIFMIIDSCLDSQYKSLNFEELLINRRAYKISPIIYTCRQLEHYDVDHFDIIIFCYESNEDMIKASHEYCKLHIDYDTFKQIITTLDVSESVIYDKSTSHMYKLLGK
jgi:hypothetical protein